ncbi:hypothetical protein N7U66_14805 [Lacinutrix neustonica]|uniref:Uncharacterized protein n=1 Tax=Lacinutrix neustonica TaxID=2980107 RepID=A0A9E8MW28_9FLAO|nr:hypothetical protein [Lacinutrix neustonica]WAC01334.1 hypothetical protein N7U66_14805 [Lacinutrix neustonica]
MKALIKYLTFFSVLFLFINHSYAQRETSKWKALIAVGINGPGQDGLVKPFVANGVNFPTINLGVQRMLKRKVGVKLDLGYNRFSNAEESPNLKLIIPALMHK